MIKEILKILENDARTTVKQISAMTGTSVAEVTQLIKEAEENRTILKYKTIINWEKAGQEQVRALIEVKVTPQKDVGFDAIAERIHRHPQARSVYLVSGTYDLLVVAIGRTEREIADFVAQKLAPIEGVQGTVTHFVLKRYKEDDEVIDTEAPVRRQPVTL